MNVVCPHCRQALEIDDRRVRRPVKCPDCRRVFNVSTTPPPRTGGSGGGSLLLLLVFLAAGWFGYAMFHYRESPAQVWARAAAFVGTFHRSEIDRPPEPTPTPTPVVPPTPSTP